MVGEWDGLVRMRTRGGSGVVCAAIPAGCGGRDGGGGQGEGG